MNSKDCIFCKTIAGVMPATKVFESDTVEAILDIGPMSPGHTLVMPKAHVESLLDLPVGELEGLFAAVQHIGRAMIAGLGVRGFNVLINNGTVAGQLIPHLHVHVVPRVETDTLTHWPGGRYRDGEMEELAQKIRAAL